MSRGKRENEDKRQTALLGLIEKTKSSGGEGGSGGRGCKPKGGENSTKKSVLNYRTISYARKQSTENKWKRKITFQG